MEETATVRCLAGILGDLLLPDTDLHDGIVLVCDKWWYFSLLLVFRLGLMYGRPLGKLFVQVARRRLGGCSLLEDSRDTARKPQVSL